MVSEKTCHWGLSVTGCIASTCNFGSLTSYMMGCVNTVIKDQKNHRQRKKKRCKCKGDPIAND